MLLGWSITSTCWSGDRGFARLQAQKPGKKTVPEKKKGPAPEAGPAPNVLAGRGYSPDAGARTEVQARDSGRFPRWGAHRSPDHPTVTAKYPPDGRRGGRGKESETSVPVPVSHRTNER